jgi:ribosome-binding protein aMBF1 (putative translation factor)
MQRPCGVATRVLRQTVGVADEETEAVRRARLYERPSYRDLCARIAGNARRLREARGWTQVQTSVRAEMAVYQYQRLESGRYNTTLTTLARLVDAFDVEPAELLRAEYPPETKKGRPYGRRRKRGSD